jgi:nucleotide-binding universal stress UspA family protein
MSDAIKTVLVATDGSESALRAEAVAIRLAAGCAVTVVP